MTSRAHYVRKYNAVLYDNWSKVRGANVPDVYLTQEQLELRRELESLQNRINQKDKRRKG